MAITSYFIEPYPGGKQTLLKGLDVTDGKARAILISTHRSGTIAIAKRDKLNAALAAAGKPE